jgi:hypothetical protein
LMKGHCLVVYLGDGDEACLQVESKSLRV